MTAIKNRTKTFNYIHDVFCKPVDISENLLNNEILQETNFLMNFITNKIDFSTAFKSVNTQDRYIIEVQLYH